MNEDIYKPMTPSQAGALGGKAKNPRKGFGSKSPEERKAIAIKAAKARWSKHERNT